MKKNRQRTIYELLSRREIQILQLIVGGHTDKQIAKKLGVSFYTVRTQHQNILRKTQQHKINGLISYAILNGLNGQKHE